METVLRPDPLNNTSFRSDQIELPEDSDSMSSSINDTRMTSMCIHSSSESLNESPRTFAETLRDLRLPDSIAAFYANRNIKELYDWQDECLRDRRLLLDRSNYIISLPTSAGKTLIAELLMLRETMVNKRNCIMILPYVAIVQELVHSLSRFEKEFGIYVEEYAKRKGRIPPLKRRNGKHSIYICTIEKANSLINSMIDVDVERVTNIGLVIVDELHMLGDGSRGVTLEMCLSKLLCKSNAQIVGMSATLSNFPDLQRFIRNVFGFENFVTIVPIPALVNFYLQAIFSRRLFLYFTLIAFQCKLAQCQINLGTFNLNKNPQGNLELGFGQGGNLFGFGGDKNLQVTLGPGLFGARTDEGVLLGGERLGVDSHLGLQEGQALNLGSLLKLGNRPVSPFDSVGQLGSLINNLGSMFQPRGPQVPSGPLLPPSRPETRPIRPETSRPEPTLIPLIEQSKRAQISKTTGDGEEFPLSVGSGWDGEGEEGSGNVPEIKGISPPEPRVMPPLKPGITTEGFRRGENGEPDPGQNSGKHDGNTGEASKPRKLPVPDGLEMISGGDNNEDSELLNN